MYYASLGAMTVLRLVGLYKFACLLEVIVNLLFNFLSYIYNCKLELSIIL